jgi:hypothetical protein
MENRAKHFPPHAVTHSADNASLIRPTKLLALDLEAEGQNNSLPTPEGKSLLKLDFPGSN